MGDKNFELKLTIDDKLTVKPDTRTLTVSIIQENFSTEGAAKEDALRRTGRVLETIKGVKGIDEKKITIETAKVYPMVKRVQRDIKKGGKVVDHEWYNETTGYQYGASITVKTKLADECSDAVWKALLLCKDATDVSPVYSIEDITPYEEELLRKVMAKAFRTAEIIAESTKAKVLYVKGIDKSVHRMTVSYEGIRKAKMSKSCIEAECDFSSIVDDIVETGANESREINDSLNITFVLGNALDLG